MIEMQAGGRPEFVDDRGRRFAVGDYVRSQVARHCLELGRIERIEFNTAKEPGWRDYCSLRVRFLSGEFDSMIVDYWEPAEPTEDEAYAWALAELRR